MARYQEVEEDEIVRLIRKDTRSNVIDILVIITLFLTVWLVSPIYPLLGLLLSTGLFIYAVWELVVAPIWRYVHKVKDPHRLIEIVEPGLSPCWFAIFGDKYARIDGYSLHRFPRFQKQFEKLTQAEWEKLIQGD